MSSSAICFLILCQLIFKVLCKSKQAYLINLWWLWTLWLTECTHDRGSANCFCHSFNSQLLAWRDFSRERYDGFLKMSRLTSHVSRTNRLELGNEELKISCGGNGRKWCWCPWLRMSPGRSHLERSFMSQSHRMSRDLSKQPDLNPKTDLGTLPFHF